MSHRKAVGIDLGTTFSAVAHIDAYGKPQIIPNAESERITPSVILFEGANVIFGPHAKNNSVVAPLGVCDIELPPFLPKGSPVELTYRYNANQVLEVAVEACGSQSKVSIERNTGLAPNEIGKALSSLEKLSVE